MTPATVLLRQIHPNFMRQGELTSQAFFPFPKDDSKLSLYDGDQITAESSFHHYTEILKNASHSVWGVTQTEISGTGLSCVADPLKDFAAHAVIDFGERSEKDCRKLAKLLKNEAIKRGCLFQPPA